MATTRKRSRSNDSDISSLYKEWDEVSCPICMDHPHNAVLLMCTSYDKGCRSYICNTSYRHSNCLDCFKTLKEEENADNSNLRCPMCRGSVLGWKVMDGARKYLDLKARSCSRESCSFSGNYMELRRHARRIHPTVCPAYVDPSRQRAWARLEGQREYNDIVSAVRSAMPRAVVLGDYVIEHEDRVIERDGDGWLSTLFFLQMISMDGGDGMRGGGSGGLNRNRVSRSSRRRRRLTRAWSDEDGE